MVKHDGEAIDIEGMNSETVRSFGTRDVSEEGFRIGGAFVQIGGNRCNRTVR